MGQGCSPIWLEDGSYKWGMDALRNARSKSRHGHGLGVRMQANLNIPCRESWFS